MLIKVYHAQEKGRNAHQSAHEGQYLIRMRGILDQNLMNS